MRRRSEIQVVAVVLAGQQCVNAVMKVVAPYAVQTVAAALSRADQANVVLVGLPDNVDQTARASGLPLHRGLNLGENVAGAEIVDGVNRVES